MRIKLAKAEKVIQLLIEGMGIRASARMTGVNHDTICSLVLKVGRACDQFLDSIRGVKSPNIEMDEMWSFVHSRTQEGKTWTWFAIDSRAKFVLSHAVGHRNEETCGRFLRRLKAVTETGDVTIKSDRLYLYAKYLPAILGDRFDHLPVLKTSTTERFNLTMRMHVRRFARHTNAHSKSFPHHAAMVALFVAYYNFCRTHEALGKKVTPAMAVGLAKKPWKIRELLAHLEVSDNSPYLPFVPTNVAQRVPDLPMMRWESGSRRGRDSTMPSARRAAMNEPLKPGVT